MSDIVEALRALGKYRCDCQQPGRGCPESPAWKAADEIEELRQDLNKWMAIACKVTDDREACKAKLTRIRKWVNHYGVSGEAQGVPTSARFPSDEACDGFDEAREDVLAILNGDDE